MAIFPIIINMVDSHTCRHLSHQTHPSHRLTHMETPLTPNTPLTHTRTHANTSHATHSPHTDSHTCKHLSHDTHPSHRLAHMQTPLTPHTPLTQTHTHTSHTTHIICDLTVHTFKEIWNIVFNVMDYIWLFSQWLSLWRTSLIEVHSSRELVEA